MYLTRNRMTVSIQQLKLSATLNTLFKRIEPIVFFMAVYSRQRCICLKETCSKKGINALVVPFPVKKNSKWKEIIGPPINYHVKNLLRTFP